jgi:hypothetical protein
MRLSWNITKFQDRLARVYAMGLAFVGGRCTARSAYPLTPLGGAVRNLAGDRSKFFGKSVIRCRPTAVSCQPL